MTAPENDLPALFAQVMLAAPTDRQAIVESLTESDSSLRRELARLVTAASSPSSLDDPLGDRAIDSRRSGLESAVTKTTSIASGVAFGGYTIDRLLGEGGMGTVYLAKQQRPERFVALKVLRQSLPTQRALRRFELEAETLGRLRHPGIAQIFEAGVHEGTPFFAMEFIDGEPITNFVRSRNLGTADVLTLLRKVAVAVQHAHQQGIIHRDLKPANILVTQASANAEPEPKILDFGVAKLTESDIQATTLRTDVGQLIGTLSYMSPEQAAGDPAAVDTRSDVYSLGVLAFELLTGQLPLDLTDRLVHEAVRIIREDEPSRISSINRMLRGDIETIVATALEKDLTRRYGSPEALANDIVRYLGNQPIDARPASTWYQVCKFSRRNRTLVSGVAASFVLLAGGLVGTTTFALRADAARQDASRAEQIASNALAAEQLRATQFEAVAAFQEEQLAELDAMSIGIGIRRGLAEQLKNDQQLLGIDFTGLAMATLDDSLFQPSRQAIDSQFGDQPTVRARLLQSLAKSAERVGLLTLSESAQREAGRIYRETLGDDAQLTVSAQSNLGLILTSLGEFDEAEQLLASTLATSRESLGAEHAETLVTLDNYALLLAQLGRLDDAEALHRESLDVHRRIFGESDQRTLAALNNMGGLLESRAMHAEAETYLRKALDGNRNILGNDHPRTLSSVSNLGVNLKQQNRLGEAEPYYQEVLDGRRRTLGSDHPRTIRALNNMGGLYRALNQPADAERIYRESLEQYRATLGESHPETAIAMSNLGASLRDQGKLVEAETIGAQAVAAARSAFPPGHWITAAFLGQHASTLLEMERLDEAAPRAIEGYEMMQATYGPDHPRSQGAANLVVRVHSAWHEIEPGADHDQIAKDWRSRAGLDTDG